MKHKDIAIAWLNGEEIEFEDGSGEWHPLKLACNSIVSYSFHDNQKYRIKPKVPEYRLYRYVRESASHVGCVYNVQRNTSWEGDKSHLEDREKKEKTGEIIWLTEWLPLPNAA